MTYLQEQIIELKVEIDRLRAELKIRLEREADEQVARKVFTAGLSATLHRKEEWVRESRAGHHAILYGK